MYLESDGVQVWSSLVLGQPGAQAAVRALPVHVPGAHEEIEVLDLPELIIVCTYGNLQ